MDFYCFNVYNQCQFACFDISDHFSHETCMTTVSVFVWKNMRLALWNVFLIVSLCFKVWFGIFIGEILIFFERIWRLGAPPPKQQLPNLFWRVLFSVPFRYTLVSSFFYLLGNSCFENDNRPGTGYYQY